MRCFLKSRHFGAPRDAVVGRIGSMCGEQPELADGVEDVAQETIDAQKSSDGC